MGFWEQCRWMCITSCVALAACSFWTLLLNDRRPLDSLPFHEQTDLCLHMTTIALLLILWNKLNWLKDK